MNETKKPWLKRDEESAQAYAAFCVYRDIGSDRTHLKALEKLGRPSGYQRQLEEWSGKYDWVSRCEAYDAHRDEVRLQAREDALREAQHKLSAETLTVLEQMLLGIVSGDISTPQQRAMADWLDRAGLKPVERVEHQFGENAAAEIGALLGVTLGGHDDS